MAIAVVRELVVGGGEFLEALRGDSGEVAGELSVLGKDHGPTRHETVDQRLLAHFNSSVSTQNPRPRLNAQMDIYTVFLCITANVREGKM